jgi:hypothetical protein
MLGLGACASNPYDTSKDRAARLVGKRAIINPDTRMKEFVYFMQLNQLDLRDRWGDYPHDIVVPGGKNKLLVACEWYGPLTAEPAARAIRQVRQSFTVGHEYEFRSEYLGEGICETKITDLTTAEADAEAAAKAAEEKPTDQAVTNNKSSTSSKTTSAKKSKKKKNKAGSRRRR